MGFGIVEAQGQTLDVACRAFHFELKQIGPAAPHLSDHGSAVIIGPCRGTREGMLEARDMSSPSTDFKVKIMLPIVFRRGLPAWARYNRLLLRGCLKRLQCENQAAQEERCFKLSLQLPHGILPSLLRMFVVDHERAGFGPAEIKPLAGSRARRAKARRLAVARLLTSGVCVPGARDQYCSLSSAQW
jgi:hypothetical protein